MAHEDRRHPPSARKLREARRRGQVAQSPFATAILVAVAACVALWFQAQVLSQQWQTLVSRVWTAEGFSVAPDALGSTVDELFGFAVSVTAPVLVACVVAAVFGSRLQAGPVFSARPWLPDWSRLSPAGAERVGPKFVETASGLALLVAVWGVGAGTLIGQLPALLSLGGGEANSTDAVAVAAGALRSVLQNALLVLVVGATIAVAYRRWRFWRDQWMSDPERRREQRDAYGEPTARRRRIGQWREIAAASPEPEAFGAAMLVVRCTSSLVAIDWTSGSKSAPRVAAVAEGRLRRTALGLAESNQVPCVTDEALGRELSVLKPGSGVPSRLQPGLARLVARVSTHSAAIEGGEDA